MANPHVHAKSSVRRYGGKLEDYLDIHIFMDKSKHAVADMRHRMLTHTPFFAEEVIPSVFGDTRTNTDGQVYSPKQVAYDHIEEDFHGQVPATADWFLSLPFEPWMMNGREKCPSFRAIAKKRVKAPERRESEEYGN